jgi:ribosome assembly protein YihI (activator of Der GTPase)
VSELSEWLAKTINEINEVERRQKKKKKRKGTSKICWTGGWVDGDRRKGNIDLTMYDPRSGNDIRWCLSSSKSTMHISKNVKPK